MLKRVLVMPLDLTLYPLIHPRTTSYTVELGKYSEDTYGRYRIPTPVTINTSRPQGLLEVHCTSEKSILQKDVTKLSNKDPEQIIYKRDNASSGFLKPKAIMYGIYWRSQSHRKAKASIGILIYTFEERLKKKKKICYFSRTIV